MIPAIDENMMKAARSRSLVDSCRCRAPSAFAARTASMRSGESEVSTPSSSTPAAWITAVSGCAAGIEATRADTAAGSETSHAQTTTSAPASANSSRSPAAPGASSPRRLASARCLTLRAVTRCRASNAPIPPVPPVIKTVPSRSHSGAGDSPGPAMRTNRPACNAPSRMTNWPSSRGGEQLRHRQRPGVGALEVGEDQPARVLRLSGADETPDRGRGEVSTGERVPGEHDQRHSGQPVVGEPALKQVEGASGRDVQCASFVVGGLDEEVGDREQHGGLSAG